MRQLVVTLLLFFILQLLVYREAFQILPSAADYILLVQMKVGEQAGPLTFFSL